MPLHAKNRSSRCLLAASLIIAALHGECVLGQSNTAGSITGTVIDSITGSSLEFANVFLGQTTIGSSSSVGGTFGLHGVSPGLYNLVVSLVGYNRKIIPILVRSGDTVRIRVRMTSRILSAGEVQVEAEAPKEWRKSLTRFTDAFFGDGNPRDCRILNPEVLNFRVEGTSLIAWTDSLVRFENPYLGYTVSVALMLFRWGIDVDSGRCVVYPFFAEPKISDNRLRSTWVSHRKEVYRGSLEHFLKAIVTHRTREEGFTVKSGTLTMGFAKPLPEEDIETSQYLRSPFVEWVPPRWLRVEYVESTLPPNLLHRVGQRVLIDSSGVLITPLAISVEGSWADKRVGDMLPIDVLVEVKP